MPSAACSAIRDCWLSIWPTCPVFLSLCCIHARSLFDPALGIKELRIAPMDAERLCFRELWRYSAHGRCP
ncbi:MAG: hypothetical protein IPJ85_09600 [Flavobacteriales bacterium]|nr:hypothetical protein [Flavobacteriales bacterium]